MELKLNIYSKERSEETGKREVIKTYTSDEYDVMYGTVEDIISLFDIDNINDTKAMLELVVKFSNKLKPLLKDVFYGLTDEELKQVKLKELVPVVANILKFSMAQFNGGSKNAMREQM